MATVKLVGPNGARFEMEEPLPSFAERKLEEGEWQREQPQRSASSSEPQVTHSEAAPRRQPRKAEE